MSGFGFFTRHLDGYEPTDVAVSLWGSDHLHGVAVSGLMARAAEAVAEGAGCAEFVPARYHVDLFRQARRTITTTKASIVRQARRLLLVDVVAAQGGEPVARASASFLMPSDTPAGEVWTPSDRAVVPPADVAPESDDPRVPLFHSAAPWSDDFKQHQNDGRHTTWQTGVPIVVGDPRSTFQSVASVADAASMVTNWGRNGVEFINTDLSLTLTRRPVSHEIGLHATDHLAADGISAGTVEVFDRAGPIGSVNVAALGNARKAVDFKTQEHWGESPTA